MRYVPVRCHNPICIITTAVLSSIEHTKKQKYSQAAEAINASFTPFVVIADGALGLEAKTFIRHLADKIAVIWQKSNSEVLGYVRARMLFSVLRASNLCIRGSRVKWRGRWRLKMELGFHTCHAE